MDGRGWLIEDPLELVRDRSERLAKAERELKAAVQLARQRGTGWREIDTALGVRTRLLKAQLDTPDSPGSGGSS